MTNLSIAAIDPEALYPFSALPSIGITLSRETIRVGMKNGTFPKSVRVSANRVAWQGRPLIAWKNKLAAAA